MKIELIAFDSFGVRSMATRIDEKIFVDPGAALGPRRFGLPPHQLEIQRLEEKLKEITKLASKSDVLVITHYHYDHYQPSADYYDDKLLLIKDPKNNINRSQFGRASLFLSHLSRFNCQISVVDNGKFELDDFRIEASPPVFHGPEKSKLGYVVMVSVEKDIKVLHASDIQFPQTEEAKKWIIDQNPDILIMSGFPTLFLGWKMSLKNFELGKRNLVEIMEKTKVKEIILDHHLLRDPNFLKRTVEVYERGEELGIKVESAAQFEKKPVEMLEAFRRELWRGAGIEEIRELSKKATTFEQSR